jgi:hypothetical protein
MLSSFVNQSVDTILFFKVSEHYCNGLIEEKKFFSPFNSACLVKIQSEFSRVLFGFFYFV